MKVRYGLAILVFAAVLAICPAALAQEWEQVVKNEMEDLDFSAWDEQMETLPDPIKAALPDGKAGNLVNRLLNGGEGQILSGLHNVIADLLRDRWQNFFNTLLRLMGVGLLSGFLLELNRNESLELGEPAGLAGFCVAVLVALNVFAAQVTAGTDCIQTISKWTQYAFPVLLTLLTAAGNTAAAGSVQAACTMLSGSVTGVFTGLIVPVIVLSAVFAVLKCFSTRLQFGPFFDLGKSAVKWLVGITTTIYIGILSLQGIVTKGVDSISLRTAKYALDKGVPIVGSMLSGSADLVMTAAGMIKNAAGVTALVLLLGMLLKPMLELLATLLLFRLSAALCGPVADGRIPKLYSALGDILSWLFGAVAAVACLFLVTVGAVVFTGIAVVG